MCGRPFMSIGLDIGVNETVILATTHGSSYMCVGILHDVNWLIPAIFQLRRVGNQYSNCRQFFQFCCNVSESNTGNRPESRAFRNAFNARIPRSMRL